jgi:hypothetical protein
LTGPVCQIIFCGCSRILARQRCRKKLPFRGLTIDACDRLLAQPDLQNPAVWTGFFIGPVSGSPHEEMER